MINISIIGSGQIGFDLLYKLIKLEFVKIVALVGRRPCQRQLPNGIFYSQDSLNFFKNNKKCCDVVFDCTDAYSAVENEKVFREQGIIIIDMTPSNIGKMYIPYVSSHIGSNFNMVTCGGQVSLPLLNYIKQNCESEIKYIEVISQISAESAGMATRINIDKYIETTESAIKNLIGISNCKVILNVNPSEYTVMETTIYIKTDKCEIKDLSEFIKVIKTYIPNYEIHSPPVWFASDLLMVHVKIIGSGDYISKYSGNLDVINCAAIQLLKIITNNTNNMYNNILDI
jgi:acetaldehyde dehydrogenase (acetylating)